MILYLLECTEGDYYFTNKVSDIFCVSLNADITYYLVSVKKDFKINPDTAYGLEEVKKILNDTIPTTI